ncbi:MAG: chromosomal replication initiator protein DnaA [Paludibacter sp.]|jgi:chromosomal replication initiator protein|nr:chromosomal replication initiator protein DnaA [Paludibacter sp.]MBP6356200.1 chromosomal replication initiator protein DnaA [Paludibacter sp.]MBP6634567.1 chromosomal replication initiator protein DnaA [Paludibacter sp.]MEA4851531.1 chromosomal replication initiator protein DnaA [Paludibacter sp.]
MSNHPEQLWNRCLSVIKDNISEAAYNTWFSPIIPLKYENNVFVLQVPSQFFVEYIEEKFIDLLRMTLYREVGNGTRLEYRVLIDKSSGKGTQIPSAGEQPKPKPQTASSNYISPYNKPQLPDIDPQLNPSYNFNNLMEGNSNKLARTAGVSIANEPGKTIFNPLFVYGQSGVGKTHLANAIGVMAKQLHPEKRILYVSANTFQIQYTDAVRANTVNDFLNFYQTIDVLIVDDIQEFAGKTGTQNTFFHIFNHLHQTGKQLVLTSDRSPVVMVGLEQRLLTRFKWGLSAEIEKPDFQLRKAILENKIYRDGLEIPADVVDFIAENVTDNVRDLEGTLVSLLAHSTLADMPLDVELAEKIVSRIVTVTRKTNTVEKIRDTVCDYFSLSVDAISTKSRKREVVQARQIAMYLSKQLTKNSLSSIGLAIGQRDHATVLHACKIVTDLMDIDKNFRLSVNEIQEKLKR